MKAKLYTLFFNRMEFEKTNENVAHFHQLSDGISFASILTNG
jgi:hypothetical protein